MEEKILNLLNRINDTQRLSFVALTENGVIDDNTAVEHIDIYDEWKAGESYKVSQLRQYEGRLYKCRQDHTSQSDHTPNLVPALWSVIGVETGSIDNPIPAVANMDYVKGLHYIENDVIYIMNRAGMSDGETVTLAYTPSQLVGQYFEIVTSE